jgi:ComEC/Rec2-related protein
MAALVILAGLVNRRYDLNNIIALTALIILFVDPAQLYDVGFQLSFVTAWGLIAFTPRITGLFARYHGSRWYKWLVFPLIISMVAQVCSTPLVAFHFGRVPLISPLANLIVVPLVSLAVLGTLVLLVAHAIWPLLGVFAGSLVDSLLRGVVHVLELFGGSSMPVLETGHMSSRVFEMSAALLAYVLVFFAVWSISHRWARRAALYTVAVVLNAFLLLELVSTTRPKQPEILVSSVPGGVAALVMSPGCDEADLILSGLAHQEYSLEEKIIGPLLNQRSISRIRHLILLSSAYSAIDDILRIANRYEADSVFVSRDLEPSVRDVIDDSRNARFTLPIVRFAGRPLAAQGPGLFLSDLGCAIRNKRGECVVTPRVTATHFSRSGQGHTSTLVIGSKWFPRAEDWIRLRRAGYNPIVCANIELLRPPNRDRVDLTPDLIPPGYLHDLSKQGPIRLPL